MKSRVVFPAVIAFLIAAAPALACTCAPTTVNDAFGKADMVVEATITKISPLPQSAENEKLVRVKIDRSWKGAAAGTTVTFVTPGQSSQCGVSLPAGTKTVFFASQQEDSVLPIVRTCPLFKNPASVAGELNKLAR
jgi:hypothetical protein